MQPIYKNEEEVSSLEKNFRNSKKLVLKDGYSINTPRKRSCVSVLMLKSTPHSVLLKGTCVSSWGVTL